MRKLTFTSIFLCFLCFYTGCNTPDSNLKPQDKQDITLGSIVAISSPTLVPVEGVGLVGGLNGKGSAECPAVMRDYLSKYILSEMSSEDSLNIGSLIESLNTAVVIVEGVMPIEDSGKSYFDLKITSLRGSQTVSLENGWLYKTELKTVGTFNIDTEVLADGVGPIFTNHISESPIDKRTGYILGGGRILTSYVIGLIINDADFQLTNNIRNRLNYRFGRNTARAFRAGIIEVEAPAQYKDQRGKFIELLKAMYVYDMPENEPNRIEKHIRQIVENPESNEGEYALEAFGNSCVSRLSTLLSSSDEHVRLRAARCMLNLRSDEGMNVLINIVMNKRSPYRIEALEAITDSGRPKDALDFAMQLLNDENFDIRMAAYEQLHKLNDSSIRIKPIASNFFLEQIDKADKKEIYVERSGQPKVVLFGSPLYCNKGFVVRTTSGEISIEAPADKDYVIVTRRFPSRPDLTGEIKCTYELGNIIQALCDELPEKDQEARGGLGVSYSDLIALLKQMCDKGAIKAEFHAGPMPKFD